MPWRSFAIGLLVVCAVGGCRRDRIPSTPPVTDAPMRQALIDSHNQRVERLATTHSDGVMEVRWTDDRGKHSEQGDLDFWHTSDDRTAVRISKVGEVFLWLGSNAERYWLFDLLNKNDRVLYYGLHGQALERLGIFGVEPLALLDLLALTPLNAVKEPERPAEYDAAHGAWVIEGQGRGGRMRILFDARSHLPLRVESLDRVGEVAAFSSLSRYETVAVPGLPLMSYPKMAELIDIEGRGTSSAATDARLKIAINHTSGDVDDRALSRVFDLDRLMQAMPTDRTQTAEPGSVAASASMKK